MIDGWSIFYEIALRCMSPDLTDDKSGNGLVPSGNKPSPVRQQGIAWANVDPDKCNHMTSWLGQMVKALNEHATAGREGSISHLSYMKKSKCSMSDELYTLLCLFHFVVLCLPSILPMVKKYPREKALV